MAKHTLSPLGLGYTVALLSALSMLLLGIAANLGIYVSAAEAMQQWHVFFDFTVLGIITGMIEAAVWGFIGGWLFGWVYNMFTK